jgi:hypothetical protein
MLASSVLPLLAIISPIASLSLPAINNKQQPLSLNDNDHDHLRSHFRDIELRDIPAITTIFIEAFSPGATWHYLMPDLQHRKAEVYTCLNAQIEQGWQTRHTNLTLGKVITVPRSKSASEQGGEELPVSFSIWNIRSQANDDTATNLSTLSPSLLLAKCGLWPPGTDLARAMDYARQESAYNREYFEEAYPHQLYLKLLATHPDWDGNGFGARNPEWGKKLSRELEPVMPVTLFATPAGYPLYDSLGFESVKNATIAMLDGLGELWFEVMRWEGKKEE